MATALEAWAIGDKQIVQFYVEIENKVFLASVSRECLEDHFGASGNFHSTGPSTFLSNADAIRKVAIAKISKGDPDPIMVSTSDF